MKNFIVEFFRIINENSELFKIAPVYKSQLVLKPHYNFFFMISKSDRSDDLKCYF